MIRIAAAALVFAASGLVASAPAEAKAKCSCAKPHKARAHKARSHAHRTVRHTRSVETVVAIPVDTGLVTKAIVQDTDAYISLDSQYLPDPQHADHVVWAGEKGEAIIADDLNKSLDIFRVCGWTGQERAAASFIAWSRTHTVPDEVAQGREQIAWQPMALDSFERTKPMEEQKGRSAFCGDALEHQQQIRADMYRQVDSLARAHAIAHKR